MSNARFRVVDSDSEEDSNSSPPIHGTARTPRRIVIDDPSSSDDESSFTTAREDENEDLDIAIDGLDLNSPATATTNSPLLENTTKNIFQDSPSTLSMIEKLQAGGVPHVVQTTKNRDSGMSSLEPLYEYEGRSYMDEETTRLATPKDEVLRNGEGGSEALVDCLSVEHDDDSKSTVVQEGRTKTPKRHDDNNNSEALLDDSLDQADVSTILNENPVQTPPAQEETFVLDYNSEPLVDSSPDDSASTVLQEGRIKTPMRQPIVENSNSEALHDSSMEDEEDGEETVCPAETPDNKSEALFDTSPQQDDTTTVLQSEAPLDNSSDEESIEVQDCALPSKAFEDLAVGSTIDLSMEEDDSSTIFPAETLVGVESRTMEPNDSPTATRLHVDESDASSDLESLARGFSDKVTVSKSKAIPVDTVDTSSDEDDSILDDKGPFETSYKPSQRSNVHDLLDTSPDDSSTSTDVQEGRVKTPKRPFLLDDDSSQDSSLSDVSGADAERAQKPASLEDAFEDCAWILDSSTNEVFLSNEKFEPPSDTSWPKLRLPRELYDRLYCHQKIGVQWMAGLHSMKIGGVLGDDMGMGKTFQSLALLGGLMRAKTIKNALVVCPVSVLQSWEKEARVVMKRSCVPKLTIIVVSSDMKKSRRQKLLQEALSCSPRLPYLVITTYGLVQSGPADFKSYSSDTRSTWNYVILDEGHTIKNPSAKVSKACEFISENPKTRRLVLTGTLIQNNLKELWSVVNWATTGQIFGTLPRFKNQYATPIEEGRHKNARSPTIKRAEMANNDLKEKLRPHYLQRMKSDFLKDELPPKRELVVWTHLSERQRTMYETYIQGDRVAEVLRGDVKSPLETITWLKKLCGHPLLVEQKEYDRDEHVFRRSGQDLLQESSKLQVLVALLSHLKGKGHRTLIFSQSTRILDILEHVLCRFHLSRIDGSTSGKHRQQLVDAFNDESSTVDAMLLSTKAAGLGLTLTGADRAIIYDPSWNPANDAQAIDRCYRIGQEKEVTVFRFIAAGTVEERMYEKQVHKDGIRRAVTTSVGNATERYFEKKDLRRVFELGPAGECEVLAKIQQSGRAACGTPFLSNHVGVVGVSSHDAIYLKSSENSDGDVMGSPFGGATPAASATKPPPMLGRSRRVLAKSKRKIDFSTKENHASPLSSSTSAVRDAAQPVRSSPTSRIVRRDAATARSSIGSTSETAIDVDDTKPPKTESQANDAKSQQVEIETLLDTADRMRKKGKDLAAMSILVDLTKNESMTKAQKLRMHKGLAEVGDGLGWLPEK